jgi:hypothetical protein
MPPAIVLSATSLVTTAPAATIAFSPIVTPGSMVTPAPIHAFCLILIGWLITRFFHPDLKGGFP